MTTTTISGHQRATAVARLGFDDRFGRRSDRCLGYCDAAYLERRISDVRFVVHKPVAVAATGNYGVVLDR